MAILGVDYGEKRIGLAIAEGKLAETLEIIENKPGVIKEINILCRREKIKKIVLGLPEGKKYHEVKNFAGLLEKKLGIPVLFWDETFTSKEAQKLAIGSGKKKKSRMYLDSIAAALILQEYLDTML